jgi:glutamate/tyrosine decarboxylase-like PLP-dependent enzyme
MSADPTALFSRAAALAANYRVGMAEALQRPAQNYGEALSAWQAPTPETGLGDAEVLEELVRLATPGLHAMTGPRFFGWVIGGSHPAGVAADMMVSAWGQNVGNYAAAPSASAAELVAGRWLVDILGLPESSSVGFVTGATMANFVCLAAARSALLTPLGWDVEAHGLFGAPPIRVVLGADVHISVLKALQYLGLGHARVHKIAVDAQGRMRPDALAAALAEGQGPLLAILQAGQINSGHSDPFAALIPQIHAQGGWVHVDGAFGLWAKAAPSLAHLADGVELADSWATDGHKWLQTPYDCGYAIVRDPEAHRCAMAFGASYLPAVTAGEREPTHYVPELSRRARGFTTWAMLRAFGRTGLAELVTRCCRLARRIAARVAPEPGVEVANEVVLNQVVLRFIDDDQTLRTIARLQRDGTAFAGASQWRGQWLMRVSVSGYATTEQDGDRTADAIIAAWRAVRAGANL